MKLKILSVVIVLLALGACSSGSDDSPPPVTSTYYQDADGDSFGDPTTTQVATSQPDGYVLDNTDCDDGVPTVNPAATEINDGIDNNCDGMVDEGFINVLTVSGVTMSLDGTWERPCGTYPQAQGGMDYLVSEIISGTSGVMGDYLYTSTDGSCTGTETIDTVFDVTLKTGAVMAITGWIDLSGASVPPPQAQDGSGTLLNNESVTSVTITINSVTPANPDFFPGMEVAAFYVVDDTVAGTPVIYGKSDSGNVAYNVPMTRQ